MSVGVSITTLWRVLNAWSFIKIHIPFVLSTRWITSSSAALVWPGMWLCSGQWDVRRREVCPIKPAPPPHLLAPLSFLPTEGGTPRETLEARGQRWQSYWPPRVLSDCDQSPPVAVALLMIVMWSTFNCLHIVEPLYDRIFLLLQVSLFYFLWGLESTWNTFKN